MQKNDTDPIEQWLQAEGHPAEDRKTLMDFAVFCEKTPRQIIGDFNEQSKRQFEKHYGEQLLKYTAQQQKKLSSNTVREQVDVIRSFFRYHKLPLKFGFSAHVQFFFK
ncbi:MAG: hypothetical protein ACQCN6_09390 [Candidatus Bathyarchaeia archaeon]|jgi:hypothetical protein